MLAEAFLLASALEVGPFYEQRRDYAALRPVVSSEGGTTDVLWPVFTSHRDWWRLCWFTHYQGYPDGGYQFDVIPLWFNGRSPGNQGCESYWGLFPLYGRHPHVLSLYDVRFCLWPAWMRYRTPRKTAPGGWMTTDAVLFPLWHWRDDGSWGLWPLAGSSHNRADDHRYALWPLLNWKTCFEDRDTPGAGTAWMLWPLFGSVSRERESQWLFLPPLFSWAEAHSRSAPARGESAPDMRLRCPWPIFEWESTAARERLSVLPLYERVRWRAYKNGKEAGGVTRFGWRLVELYDDETRVFPFWTSRKDGSYFRLWPLWESATDRDGVSHGRFLSLFPIRWVDAVDRNWSKFWTFYENESNPVCTYHSLLWGIFRWRTVR
ncbi:MAG: hypothetical protein J6T51_03560 [Kiritimatiellae bacterium]|nr:hypothetical protein [Kiritimatiellia bacterium]